MDKRIERKYPLVTEVSDDERIGMVKEIFSTVTSKYDFLNHLLSLRRDIAWRRFATRKMHFFRTSHLLDVATGTADLAIDTASRYPSTQVIGVDFVREMIDLGLAKIEKKDLSDRIHLFRGDALALPFRDNRFDVAAIAFGIRNIPDKSLALKEMRRVVVPGGQVMVLEMTSPSSPLFKKVYRLYLNRILPRMASAFSQNPGAYYYLADSIRSFPSPHAFAKMMEEAGLTRVERHPLDFGITYLHIGIKPK